MHIKLKVNQLINKYKTNNVYELCDYLGIKVFIENLGNIKGFYQNESGCCMIHLNSNLNEFEKRVVLAHEIGHAVLHKNMNICLLKTYLFSVTNRYETQANKFAAELLISDSELEDCIKDFGNLSIEQISKHFNVPESFVQYKNI